MAIDIYALNVFFYQCNDFLSHKLERGQTKMTMKTIERYECDARVESGFYDAAACLNGWRCAEGGGWRADDAERRAAIDAFCGIQRLSRTERALLIGGAISAGATLVCAAAALAAILLASDVHAEGYKIAIECPRHVITTLPRCASSRSHCEKLASLVLDRLPPSAQLMCEVNVGPAR
jgi:hypothetical protein